MGDGNSQSCDPILTIAIRAHSLSKQSFNFLFHQNRLIITQVILGTFWITSIRKKNGFDEKFLYHEIIPFRLKHFDNDVNFKKFTNFALKYLTTEFKQKNFTNLY